MGEQWFDEYWVNYGTAMMIKDGNPIKIQVLGILEFKEEDLFDKVNTKGLKEGNNEVFVPPIKSQGIKTKSVDGFF